MTDTATAGPTATGAQQPKKRGMARLAAACRNSVKGLKSAMSRDEAVRQEIAAVLVLTPTAYMVCGTLRDGTFLVLAMALVVLTELLNTAIEVICDRITRVYDVEIGMAKDVASAAVTISLAMAALAWASALVQRFAS